MTGKDCQKYLGVFDVAKTLMFFPCSDIASYSTPHIMARQRRKHPFAISEQSLMTPMQRLGGWGVQTEFKPHVCHMFEARSTNASSKPITPSSNGLSGKPKMVVIMCSGQSRNGSRLSPHLSHLVSVKTAWVVTELKPPINPFRTNYSVKKCN